METKIAFAHPGKIGDAFYCLPAIRWICNRRECKADFYTSSYCAPMKRLVEYQPYINKFIVLDEYIVEGNGPGYQPWYMPVPSKGYDCVFQLGYKYNPDRFLGDWMARTAGAPEKLPVWYDFPASSATGSEYIVLSPRGETTYKPLFEALADNNDIPVIQIGAKGEAVGPHANQDFTGLDFLETLELIAGAKAFVGLMSASLVLANGFPHLPKFVPHDGKSWDMRHVLYSTNHHYLVDPTPGEIMRVISGGSMQTYSKTIHRDDWVEEMDHSVSVRGAMSDISHRFEHPKRAWEYGMVLSALRKADAETVLDVGGGGSIFAPACEWPEVNMSTTIVDPGDVGKWIVAQKRRLMTKGRPGVQMDFHQEDFLLWKSKTKFDAVTCISTIEHVAEDIKFFNKLLSFVKKGGVFALTTDFHPSGHPQVDGHIRTYNADGMKQWADIAIKKGFEFYLGDPSWDHFEAEVNNYTFASLIMRKK